MPQRGKKSQKTADLLEYHIYFAIHILQNNGISYIYAAIFQKEEGKKRNYHRKGSNDVLARVRSARASNSDVDFLLSQVSHER